MGGLFSPAACRFGCSQVPPLHVVAIRWCITLLHEKRLVQSPLVRARLVRLLEQFMSAVMGPLIAMRSDAMPVAENLRGGVRRAIFGRDAVTVTALVDAYVDVGVVAGLDVDKENFDKYSVRKSIASLLMQLLMTPSDSPQLWAALHANVQLRRTAGADAAAAAAPREVRAFNKFVDTVVNDLHHLLDDALGRLEDIRSLQLAKEARLEWEAQSEQVRAERDAYLRAQERTARGFLALATAMLQLLARLTQLSGAAVLNAHGGMAPKLASLLIRFFDKLCGPQAKRHKVKQPQRYGFDPQMLLAELGFVAGSLVAERVFQQAWIDDYDYSSETLGKAISLLQRQGLIERQLGEKLGVFRREVDAQVAALMGDDEADDEVGGAAAAAVAAMDEGGDDDDDDDGDALLGAPPAVETAPAVMAPIFAGADAAAAAHSPGALAAAAFLANSFASPNAAGATAISAAANGALGAGAAAAASLGATTTGLSTDAVQSLAQSLTTNLEKEKEKKRNAAAAEAAAAAAVTTATESASSVSESKAGKAKEKRSASSAASDVMSRAELDELEQRYARAMRPLGFDACSMRIAVASSSPARSDAAASPAATPFRHHFASQIEATPGASSRKMRRVVRECEMLYDSLPISVGSSIFVRIDEDRADVMKALITGPADTPYSGGCFEFHIFLPNEYPQVPPLVNMETTGNGTVRFNPNLYNCGKVCLSLLGTWHGASREKWNAAGSTLHQVSVALFNIPFVYVQPLAALYQVFVSIQGLILIEQPYFNEPAYDVERGTPEGRAHSFAYNEELRLNTIRHAMIGQIRAPPVGFERTVRRHFRTQRKRIEAQCARWLRESSPKWRRRMTRAVNELRRELKVLAEVDEVEEEDDGVLEVASHEMDDDESDDDDDDDDDESDGTE